MNDAEQSRQERAAVNPARRRDTPHNPNEPLPTTAPAEEPPVRPFQPGPEPDPLDSGGIDEATTSG